MDYIPIDQWAEEKHPKLLRNIQAHVEILCSGDESKQYFIVRGLMQFIRQEFESA